VSEVNYRPGHLDYELTEDDLKLLLKLRKEGYRIFIDEAGCLYVIYPNGAGSPLFPSLSNLLEFLKRVVDVRMFERGLRE